MIGRYVIVRTVAAGVFAGTLRKLEGEQAELTVARRLWYWSGAASLSELAVKGTKKPQECKFPCAVSEILLRGVIEVIPTSEAARASIEEVPEWKA